MYIIYSIQIIWNGRLVKLLVMKSIKVQTLSAHEKCMLLYLCSYTNEKCYSMLIDIFFCVHNVLNSRSLYLAYERYCSSKYLYTLSSSGATIGLIRAYVVSYQSRIVILLTYIKALVFFSIRIYVFPSSDFGRYIY